MARFEVVRDDMRRTNGEITLPTRGSKYAAGYDFYTPTDIYLYPHSQTLVFTDVKAQFAKDQVLMLFVRSSIGIKKHICLANGTGIIDADYYGNDSNDGNIGFCLFNFGDEKVHINKGERIGQGILLDYDEFDNGNTEDLRQGGMGSSGK